MLFNKLPVLETLPKRPGVYLMKDGAGKILYIGKAASLAHRVRSYFQPSANLSPRVASFVRQVADLETIVTDSEWEALVLESNLIKKHKPRYNVILRDDKHYPYLKLTTHEPYPRLIVVRRIERDGAKYFGPFQGGAVREMLGLIHRIFPLRNCPDLASRKCVCLEYHIKRCLGPCVHPVDPNLYREMCKEIMMILEGRIDPLAKRLGQEMHEAAAALEFERAAVLRNRLRAISKISESQKVISPDLADRDVFALVTAADLDPKEARDPRKSCAVVFQIRQGKLVNRKFFFPQHTEHVAPEEILETCLTQYYSEVTFIPDEVLISHALREETLASLKITLTEQKQRAELNGGKAVELRTPQRGEKAELVQMAVENGKLLLKHRVPQEARQAMLSDLTTKLHLEKTPFRIEGFDISHLSGSSMVGSMVVFTEGVPDKKQYRLFNIQSLPEGMSNDVGAIYEVVKRRYGKTLKDKLPLPDLILIDGGKGQVSAAYQALRELGLDYLPLLGLAKRLEEIYLVNRKNPLRLSERSLALRLLQQIRDEAHRFAITRHRARRKKQAIP